MKEFFSRNVPFLMGGSILLVLVSAVAIRSIQLTRVAPVVQPASVTQEGVPAFTSASFETGDAIGALGPEWTLIRQGNVTSKNVKVPNGMRATRETLAHLIHTSSTLLVTELVIDDERLAQVALQAINTEPVVVADRSGYIVQIPSLTGSSGLLLVGTSTAVLLEYGQEPFENFLSWPTEVPAAIQSYIHVVPVR